MKKKKEGAGGRLNRSEIVQARLNPKIRFAADLVSRYERQTLSSLIESSLDLYLTTCKIGINIKNSYEKLSVKEAVELLWSPDEAIRFIKIASSLSELLTNQEADLWLFILDTQYFWAHYNLKVIDPKTKLIKYRMEPLYDHPEGVTEGIIIEHLQEYWDAIQTEEGRKMVKIPDKIGKTIDPPPGVETEIVEPHSYDVLLSDDHLSEVDRKKIWKENIIYLIREESEIIETPDGPRVKHSMIYPTPEEQMEMVERIYQAKNKCRSNSEK